MINEVVEVKDYLIGNNIHKRNLYRICYMIAKWYKEKGLSRIEIRRKIYEWGEKYGVFIKYNLNNIINKAIDDKVRLKDNISIRINAADIEEIKSRFDSKTTRLTALSVLCYAKAYADRDKLFQISSAALGAWLGIDDANLRKRHLKELIDYEYISKVSTPNNSYKWENENINCQYKINVSLENTGCYILEDNNISGLYTDIFR